MGFEEDDSIHLLLTSPHLLIIISLGDRQIYCGFTFFAPASLHNSSCLSLLSRPMFHHSQKNLEKIIGLSAFYTTLFATLKSEIRLLQMWKSERPAVGGCWIIPNRGLTDWLYYCNGIKLMMRVYSLRLYYKNCLNLTRDKFDLIS